jgi:hypothetical protein
VGTQPATSSLDKASLYFGLAQVDQVTNALDALVPRAKRREVAQASRWLQELNDVIPRSAAVEPPLIAKPIAGPQTEETAPIDGTVMVQQEEAEAWLRENCAAASEEMTLASERIVDAADAVGYRQAGLLSQCLESLRRALRMLADCLVPPGEDKETDRFGKECRTDLAGYVSRLHLALERLRAENGLFEYEKSELDLFHRRMGRLNDRLGSGVHGTADYEEARQLFSDVWRMVAVYRRVTSARPACG